MADGKQIIDGNGKRYLNASGSWDVCEDCCALPENCFCDSGNVSDPRILLTLSWSSAAVTRTFLGCTWTNGETKEVCPGSYLATSTKESWVLTDFTGSWSAATSLATPTPIGQRGISFYGRNKLETGTTPYGAPQSDRVSVHQLRVGIAMSYTGASPAELYYRFNQRRDLLSGTTNVFTSTNDRPNVNSDNLDFSAFKSSAVNPFVSDAHFGQATFAHPNNGETITLKWERLARSAANPNVLTTTTVTPTYWQASAP